jgi:hypothetical protein
VKTVVYLEALPAPPSVVIAGVAEQIERFLDQSSRVLRRLSLFPQIRAVETDDSGASAPRPMREGECSVYWSCGFWFVYFRHVSISVT